MSVDEIEKENLASAREKTQELSIAPPQSIEVQPTMSIVVYQRKDTMSSHISTKVQTVSVPTITIIEKEGTPVQTSQEASPAPTPQEQGGVETTVKEKDRTKYSILTMKLEEVIAIQTQVTLPDTATSTPSQALHRPSKKSTPLQASRPSPSTSKVDEVTPYGDINLDEVI